MEEKKLDLNSIIGFALLFGIIVWMFSQMQPSKEQLAAEKAKKAQTEKVALQKTQVATAVKANAVVAGVTDSLQLAKLQGTLGNFAYSASLPTAKDGFTTLENDLVSLKIANKGGFIVEAKLKNF